MLQSHRISEVDEESSLRFFSALMDTLRAAGYEHYGETGHVTLDDGSEREWFEEAK